MQQYYDEKQLVDSFTFKKKFGDDAFDLFKLFYPNRYEVSASDGYRTIYTKDDKTTVSYFGKLGANYKAFTFLMNVVIDKFIQDGIISKPGECDPRYLPGYEKIMDYLRNNQVYFVSLLPELGQIIKKTSDLGDKAEIQGIKKVFGDYAYKLSVSSTKSATGHLLGASGAIEAIFSIKALQDGILPPTLNLENIEDDCDLDLVPLVAKKKDIQYAMSNSFGFGGTNGTLIFKKYSE